MWVLIERRAIATTDQRALALALGVLWVGAIFAVDPYSLVPTGPLRWCAIALATGAATGCLFLRPIRLDRASAALWLGLLAWLGVATVAASDALYAWIGTPDRRLGFLAWMTFPLLFACGQQLRGRAERVIVMRGAALSGLGVGVWSCFELAGYSPVGATFADGRVGGPFGQPAFLGAAALLLLPLSVGLAVDGRERTAGRVLAVAGATGALVALLASQTRGAWIGAAVAGVAIVASRPHAARAARLPLAVGAGALALLFVVTPLGARVTSAFDTGDGTARGRLDEWRVAARVIVHNPIAGVGPEGYRSAFPREVDARYVQRYGADVITDRAHNGVLDVTAIGGLPAGLIYALLLLLLLRRAARAARLDDLFAIALAGVVIAYVVQQQVLFPLSELDPLFWVVAGMLVAATPSGRRELRVPTLGRVAVVAVAVATTFAIVMGAREVVADRDLARAAHAPGRSRLDEADRATQLRPDSIRTWFVAARIAARGSALTDLDDAIARIAAGRRRSPEDPALREEYARLLVARALRSGLDVDLQRATAVVAGFRREARECSRVPD